MRELDDYVAGFGQAEFITGDGFDLVRIGLERLYFVGKLRIFLVQTADFALNPCDFQFRAAHSEKTVYAKNVVKK